jgi:hypothetical protein
MVVCTATDKSGSLVNTLALSYSDERGAYTVSEVEPDGSLDTSVIRIQGDTWVSELQGEDGDTYRLTVTLEGADTNHFRVDRVGRDGRLTPQQQGTERRARAR